MLAIITRDAARAAPYIAALGPLGLRAIAMPLLREQPPDDPEALARAIRTGTYAHVVVTSARAAAALIHAAGPAGAALPNVWAVGPATARVLAAAGIHATAHGDTGADLATALVARYPLTGYRVLLPRAADGREDAAAILRAAGADVHDLAAYAMIPIAAGDPALDAGLVALQTGTAAICAVFAPSQVAALAALLGPLPRVPTRFVAIGRTTGAALAEAGVTGAAIAAAATPEAMAAAVTSVYPAT